MTIVQINCAGFSSTGGIMFHIADAAREAGHRVINCYPKSSLNRADDGEKILIGDRVSKRIHRELSRFSGRSDCRSVYGTQALLKRLDELKPDIIQLHNLHGHYIDCSLLFKYIKKNKIRTVWTLHDCWAFTGSCAYFDYIGCDRWKTGCHDCPNKEEYPVAALDRSSQMWNMYRELFTGVEDMTLVTPSEWLAGLVKQSYLSEYPVVVINNGIDLGVFKPTESDFRQRYGLENKHIVLGVAAAWGKRKGLDVFIELAERLDDSYRIVLVGTDDEIDRILPKKIISIHRTGNQKELAEIYTAADAFVNPTREDTYPTVNMEAIACGTPVITFRTGGSPEIIDNSCGVTVDCGDIDAMECEIVSMCGDGTSFRAACLERRKDFDKGIFGNKYAELIKGKS